MTLVNIQLLHINDLAVIVSALLRDGMLGGKALAYRCVFCEQRSHIPHLFPLPL